MQKRPLGYDFKEEFIQSIRLYDRDCALPRKFSSAPQIHTPCRAMFMTDREIFLQTFKTLRTIGQ